MAKWLHILDLSDIFHREDLPFTQLRDEIVQRIRASDWCDTDDGVLEAILLGLEESESYDDFDDAWEGFYDWADQGNRVWVKLYQ